MSDNNSFMNKVTKAGQNLVEQAKEAGQNIADSAATQNIMEKVGDAGGNILERAKDLGGNLKDRAEDAGQSLRKQTGKLFYRDEAAQEGDIEARQGFVERLEVAGENLLDKAKELLQESNTRRLIVRSQDDKELLEVPLTGGIVAGGVLAFVAPIVAVLTAVGGAVARVKLEVIRDAEIVEDVQQLEADNTGEAEA